MSYVRGEPYPFSNDVKLHAIDWTFMTLSAVEREIDNIFFVKFQVWWQKTSISPHFISTSISVCNAQSFPDHLSKSHNNLKTSPFRTIEVLKGTIIEIFCQNNNLLLRSDVKKIPYLLLAYKYEMGDIWNCALDQKNN
jgi:hypothetical protein